MNIKSLRILGYEYENIDVDDGTARWKKEDSCKERSTCVYR